MDKSNPYVILFRFAQVLRYIFQISEKNPILALFYGKGQKCSKLPRTTIKKRSKRGQATQN